jgi:hypothetical protein
LLEVDPETACVVPVDEEREEDERMPLRIDAIPRPTLRLVRCTTASG